MDFSTKAPDKTGIPEKSAKVDENSEAEIVSCVVEEK